MTYTDDETCIAIATVYAEDSVSTRKANDVDENLTDFAILRGMCMAENSSCASVGTYRPRDPCDPTTWDEATSSQAPNREDSKRRGESFHGRTRISRKKLGDNSLGRSGRREPRKQNRGRSHETNTKLNQSVETRACISGQLHQYHRTRGWHGSNRLQSVQSRSDISSEKAQSRIRAHRGTLNSEPLRNPPFYKIASTSCIPSSTQHRDTQHLARLSRSSSALDYAHEPASLRALQTRTGKIPSSISLRQESDQALSLNISHGEMDEKRRPHTEGPCQSFTKVRPVRHKNRLSEHSEPNCRPTGTHKSRSARNRPSVVDKKGQTEGRHQPVQHWRSLSSVVQELSNQWERVRERIALGTSRLLNARPSISSSSSLDHGRVTGATQSSKIVPSEKRRFPAYDRKKGSKSSSLLVANSDQDRRSDAIRSQKPGQNERRLLPARYRNRGSKSTPLLDVEDQEQGLSATQVEPNINNSAQDRAFHDSLKSRAEERGDRSRSKRTIAFMLDDTFPQNSGRGCVQDTRDRTKSDKGHSPAQVIAFLLKQPNA